MKRNYTYFDCGDKIFHLSGWTRSKVVESFDIETDVNAFLEKQKITLSKYSKDMICIYVLVDLVFHGYLYYINHKDLIIKAIIEQHLEEFLKRQVANYNYWKEYGFMDAEAKRLAGIE